jgi:CBS domain-containing protein
MLARIAILSPELRAELTRRKLGDLLPLKPIFVALDDPILVAAATMLDHGLFWLPVVQTKGGPATGWLPTRR